MKVTELNKGLKDAFGVKSASKLTHTDYIKPVKSKKNGDEEEKKTERGCCSRRSPSSAARTCGSGCIEMWLPRGGATPYSTGSEGIGGLAAAVAARFPTRRSQIASR